MSKRAAKTDWSSTPEAARHRRGMDLTVAADERAALEDLAEALGESCSRVAGALFVEALSRFESGTLHLDIARKNRS